MICDAKQQTRPYASEEVSEIALDSLSSADCLLIKTANSTYRFLVTDPAKRHGILMGGTLGGGAATCVLLGAQIMKARQPSLSPSKLSEGSQAIFFVAAADRVRQLVTSTITKLVHTRARITHQSESPTYVSGDRRPHLNYPDGEMWELREKRQ